MAEEAVYAGSGSVYHFTEAGGWQCADGGASHVYLYRNNSTVTYRLLGSAIATQAWVLNTPVHRDVKLQISQQTFASWRDPTGAGFGVHFATEADLKRFTDAIDAALLHSKEAAAAAASQAAAATDAALAAAEALIAKTGTLRKIVIEKEPAVTATPTKASSDSSLTAPVSVIVDSTHAQGSASPAPAAPAPTYPRTPSPRASSDPTLTSSPSPTPPSAANSPLPNSNSSSSVGLPAPSDGAPPPPPDGAHGSHVDLTSSASALQVPKPTGEQRSRGSTTAGRGSNAGEKKISNVRASVAMDAGTVSNALANGDAINADGSKNLRKAAGLNERELVAREIFTTEHSYFTALDLLVQCMESASSNGVLSEADVRSIFLNVRPVRTLSAQLLAEFQQRVEKWTEASKLGDVFLQLIPFFKVYRDFCAAYDSALLAYQKANERKEVRTHFKQFEPTGADGAVQALSFLLIMPVQRIPRYVLLLKELIKRTPAEHTDIPDLQAALTQLQEFAAGVNEQMRESEQARRLHEMLSSGQYAGLAEAIEGHHSKLLFDAPVSGRLPPARTLSYVLVFNDMLALLGPADAKRPELRRVEHCVPLELLWIAPSQADALRFIALSTPEFPLLLESENDVARKHLVEALGRAVQACVTARVVEVKTTGDHEDRKVSYTFADGRQYEGWWRAGSPHGHGSMKWPSGIAHYTGEWVSGRFEGSGKLTRGEGKESIEGDWVGGVPHGQATLTSATHTYKGGWQHGMRHGQGTFISVLGEQAVGEWAEDQLNGTDCKLAHACGAVYEGGMRNDRPEGNGKLTWFGGVYTGEWKEGRKEGTGELVSANGEVYNGAWKDDKREGKGTLTCKQSNTRYEGEWKADRRHGHGTQSGPEGSIEGEWRDNAPTGNATVVLPDGTRYEGELAAYMREGKGKLTRPNGDTYEGRWHASRRFGRGVESSVQEGKYDGEWQRDERHGKGTLTYPDGSKYSGDWEGGLRHGEGFFASPGDAIKYNGHWQRDKRHGHGAQIDKNGRYEGEWKADRRDGQGTYRDNRTQQLFQGTWIGDRRDGEGVITFADGTQLKVTYRNGLRMRPPTVPPVLPPVPHFTKN